MASSGMFGDFTSNPPSLISWSLAHWLAWIFSLKVLEIWGCKGLILTHLMNASETSPLESKVQLKYNHLPQSQLLWL